MSANKRFKIGIFDSGAGGLSISKEIQNRGIDVDQIYVADKAHFPYGLLDEQTLLNRLHALVAKTMLVHAPNLIILACNTASTLALPSLRERWDIPFIGVVPAIKPAAEQSQTKEIGVLATPATINRDYLQNLIQTYASDTNVHCVGSSALVELSEHYLLQQAIDQKILEQELARLLTTNTNIDLLVLACTHFSLIKNNIIQIVADRNIRVIDSTDAIVNRLTELMTPHTKSTRTESAAIKNRLIIENTAEDKLEAYKAFLNHTDYEIDLKAGLLRKE